MPASNAKKSTPAPSQAGAAPHGRHTVTQLVGKDKAGVKSVPITHIKGLASLGQGYLIIKVDPSMLADAEANAEQLPKTLLGELIPEIPMSQVKRLLARLADGGKPAGAPAKRAAANESGAADNQAFLTNHARQAAAARAKHVADGSLLTPAEVWERLAISRQAVSKAVKENRMFSLDGPAGKQLYPAFFTDPKYDRREVERVSQALGDLPGPSKWQFFTTGKGSLGGRTPLVALANGDLDGVLVAAAGFAER
ncbi:hypothetical protein ACFDR9_000804 [Janthinobacterium sp. CG_23.3]|uniref:hypothetical protein n=1 Tax=Janthinobacterium sp. CG_23.3 TaxID=3349634 RepID=UPI0038D3DD55